MEPKKPGAVTHVNAVTITYHVSESFVVGDFEFRTLRGDVDAVRLVSCQECAAIVAAGDVRKHRDSIHPARTVSEWEEAL